MYTIATLDDLRRRLRLLQDETAADQDLLRSLQQASSLVESLTQRRFCPRLDSITIPLAAIPQREIALPDDLLELRSIHSADNSLPHTQFRLLPQNPDEPAGILQHSAGQPFPASWKGKGELRIQGIWGWHDRWRSAWRVSGDHVQGSALTETARVITVRDSAGEDEDGLQPRFHIGHILRINEEYLRVTGIDHSQNRLTVLRGTAGTVAQAHARGTSIATYAPAPAVRDLVLRYAEMLYRSGGLLERDTSALLESLRRLSV